MSLTMERAKELIAGNVTEEHLIIHSLNVCYAMEASTVSRLFRITSAAMSPNTCQ